MPSFFTKVFGRKKHEEKDRRASESSLLEGKFEAIQHSPTLSDFPNSNAIGKEKEGFSLLKPKSRPSLAEASSKKSLDAPHLSLNLSSPKDNATSRALGVVFEADPDAQFLLPSSVIGERRLNPLETLILVRACSHAITARGLETLGVMHPHWYSASPEIQRRLISLFIQSLAPRSPITTLSPTPTAATSAFESEMSFARSPYDVAAVLRWGLRHLQIEGGSFGQEERWYQAFFEAEQASSYPPKAFSEILIPRLKNSHVEILTVTLEILSSLAAHSEANGISGSKLSKFLGLWLLTARRAEETDNWSTFYARWERAGRILEHLFLARIRDEATEHRMPTRLLELVRNYPFAKGSPTDDLALLPRPRFSTRQYDALYVRIDTQLSASIEKPKYHPLRLIAEAFKADSSSNDIGNSRLWDQIKQAGKEGYPDLSRIFGDETIRFLSLISTDATGQEHSFSLNPQRATTTRRRSFSMSDQGKDAALAATAAANGARHSREATTGSSIPASSPSPPSLPTDWASFSTTGFVETTPIGTPLASTLLDKDVEVTVPKSKKSRGSPSRGRKSLDNPPKPPKPVVEEAKITSKAVAFSIVQLDEAFIDFWSDALLDPISSNWPYFIVCKLKKSAFELGAPTNIDWLVIEQTFSKPTPPPIVTESISTPNESNPRKSRASSPKPSFKSDISSSFIGTRKRFSFFATSRPSSTDTIDKASKSKRRGGKSPKIGEMGEILVEEEEKGATAPAKPMDAAKRDSLGIAGTGTSALVTGVAVVSEKAKNGHAGSNGGLDTKDTLPTPPSEVSVPVEAPLVPDGVSPAPAVKEPSVSEPVREKEREPIVPDGASSSIEDTQDRVAPVVSTPISEAALKSRTPPLEETIPELRTFVETGDTAEPAPPDHVEDMTSVSNDSTLPIPQVVDPDPVPLSQPIASEVETPELSGTDVTPISDILDLIGANIHAEETNRIPDNISESALALERETSTETGPDTSDGSQNFSIPQVEPIIEGNDSDVITLVPVPIVDEEPSNAFPSSKPLAEPVSFIPPVTDGAPKVAQEQPSFSEVFELPPAPQSVVALGETPGPQIALRTSESVAVAQAGIEPSNDAGEGSHVQADVASPEVVEDSDQLNTSQQSEAMSFAERYGPLEPSADSGSSVDPHPNTNGISHPPNTKELSISPTDDEPSS